MLRILFLGTGGSLPTRNRNPSSIMINIEGELLLFDCGEGTQQQMMRAKTGMKALTSVFITHFHADHMLGVPGLIQTMSFLGRTEPLKIYGPQDVKEFVNVFIDLGYYKPRFEVEVIELSPGDIVKRNGYCIQAIGTIHSVPSIGYALTEDPRRGRFDREKAIALGVPPGPLFSKLHNNVDVEINGQLIRSADVVGQKRAGRKIVYTGDTRPCESILQASMNADVLIHDSTLARDKEEWAKESKHSTAFEAANLAKEANVIRLVLTHISSRYTDDTSSLLKEAQEIFKNVIVAEDLMEIDVPLKDK
ncbi:ribonuclease Z [Methanomethylovorans sp.]|uniref:ribonuclease Z n=1 Tax=Methanomethylovorans sp. TaxID=2758717 RepID=UPI00345E6AAA